MGVSNDLVIATPDDAAAIAAADNPVEEFGGMVSRLDMIPLCTLMNIAAGTTKYTESFDGFDLVNEDAAESAEGPWITTVHPDLGPALASIAQENKLSAIAQEWAKTEELAGWDVAELEQALQGLIDCFAQAQAQGKEVYMVNAL